MYSHCETCQNTHWRDSTEICPRCSGTCYDRHTSLPCERCKGAGAVPARKACPLCNPRENLPDKRLIIR
jgi:DnaJ-class molecular chaperone